jgi:hypothetical protein
MVSRRFSLTTTMGMIWYNLLSSMKKALNTKVENDTITVNVYSDFKETCYELNTLYYTFD